MSVLGIWIVCALVTALSATIKEEEIFEDVYSAPTTGEEIVDCPIHWSYRCTAPLDRLLFSKLSKAKVYCDDIGGYIGGGNCNIEPRTRLSRNECCRSHK